MGSRLRSLGFRAWGLEFGLLIYGLSFCNLDKTPFAADRHKLGS